MIHRLGRKSGLHDDGGAFAVLYAVLVLVLVGILAFVFDLAMVRQDRRAQRLAADAAAVAGAARLGETISPDPQAACVLAWRYARVNLGVTTQDDKASNCATVFLNPTQAKYAPCPTTASTATGSFTIGTATYTVSTSWPVFDTDSLMNPDIRPAPSTLTQPVVGSDSLPCKRLGVRIKHSQSFAFAGIWGFTGMVVDDHSVAINTINGDTGDVAAPLVILDPRSCNALTAEGGGGVDIKINTSVTPPIPGLIAISSDGLGGDQPCNGGQNVVNSNAMSGSGTLIWAEGSTAAGPGQILMYAPFPPSGDAFNPSQVTCASSMSPSGALCPRPDGLPSQISRTFMDERYNCSVAQSCTTSPDPKDGIRQLKAFATSPVNFGLNPPVAPAGFTIVSGSECTSPKPFYSGSVFVDCTGSGNGIFTVSGKTAFSGTADALGNPVSGDSRGIVVFAGNVKVNAGGCLLFNVSQTEAGAATACLSPTLSSLPQDGPLVFVTGTLQVGSGGSLMAPQTFVYEGACSTDGAQCSTTPANLSVQSGSSGNVLWSAPLGTNLATPGACLPAASTSLFPTPACFTKLALWNEYATPNNSPDTLNGQAALLLQGTFFTPNAQFNLSGGSAANIQGAQFVTKRLDVNGGAVLTMIPDPGHTNLVPLNGGALIR